MIFLLGYGLRHRSKSVITLCLKAFNKLPNKFGYQGDYSEEEEETGYDEFALRMYDPTIGRWISGDPYDEFASPYIGMGNNPVNNVDPDGGGIDFGPILRGIFGFESIRLPGNPINRKSKSFRLSTSELGELLGGYMDWVGRIKRYGIKIFTPQADYNTLQKYLQ